MEIVKERDQNIILNLKDAGCTPETVIFFLQLWEDGKTDDQLCLLAKHRQNLLTEIHREQARLDCLDYLVCQIRKKQSANSL